MPATDPPLPLAGEALLEAVTDAVVAFHVRYYHRRPTNARTQLLEEDMLACTLTGIYTDVEKTLIELQRRDVVHESRQSFEAAMQDRFIEAVEGLSGRTVLAFISTHHVGPDLAVELFMLGPAVAPSTP